MEERTVRAWTRAETERREGDPHPRFPGVTLKERADGAVRVLTVRVEPDREIGTHRHEREWEIHQVLEGRGCLETEEGTFPYEPGAGTRIPPGVSHRVAAGPEGLLLLAVFAPRDASA
ncbi:cupin domain-containing protein [Aminomonas paucivorans]|uniref:cupin domain-containing protein n=2 Tax=Aminomonas paucivorans TaxID=81412 RepID=UPI003319594E